MKNDIRIYLSSTSFNFFDFKNKNWKKKFIKYMRGYEFFVPYNQDSIEYTFIDPLQTISNEAEIVQVDLDCIQSSDYVVVYLPKKLTIGTMMELTYSVLKFGANKVILIDKTRKHRQHPWIKYWVNSWCVCDNEEHAAHVVSQYISDKVNKIRNCEDSK